MKRLFLVGAAALLSSTAAFAADLPAYRSAPHVSAPYMYDWSGLRVGLTAGYGWGKREMTPNFNEPVLEQSGAVAGGLISYDAQLGRVVFGAISDLSWSGMSADNDRLICRAIDCGEDVRQRDRNSLMWFGTVRGRIGYAFGSFLPYVTGGLAYGQAKQEFDVYSRFFSFGSSVKNMQVGWTAGGGFRLGIDRNWSVGVEALHVNLGESETRTSSSLAATGNSYNIVRAEVAYRF